MRKLMTCSVLLFLLSPGVFALTGYEDYKTASVVRMNEKLAGTLESSVWTLLDLLDDGEMERFYELKVYSMIRRSFRNYLRSKLSVGESAWINVFSTRLLQSFDNANLFTGKGTANYFPVGLRWRCFPEGGISGGENIRISFHARNGNIITRERLSGGTMPYQMLISFQIESFRKMVKQEKHSIDETLDLFFLSLKPHLKRAKAELMGAFGARGELHRRLFLKISERIQNGELPISPRMHRIHNQDVVLRMIHMWSAQLSDRETMSYPLNLIMYYLFKNNIKTTEEGKTYLEWPLDEDFGKMLFFFSLISGPNPTSFEENDKYFEFCYSELVKRFEEFNDKFKAMSVPEKVRFQNLHNFLPYIAGASGPMRMLLFENCFDAGTWSFLDAKKCRLKSVRKFSSMLSARMHFIEVLHGVWMDLVAIWEAYYHQGKYLTYEEYEARKVDLEDNVDFFESHVHNTITRTFLDDFIGVKDNRLVLQMDSDASEIELESALNRLLTNYDGAFINLADLYLTGDDDFVSLKVETKTKKVPALDGSFVDIPVTYQEADELDVEFKRDRDLVWGMVHAQAMLPQSRTQWQGSCATNAFLNVYSLFRKENPDIIDSPESEILSVIQESTSSMYHDLRDGMSPGVGWVVYGRALEKCSGGKCTIKYCPVPGKKDVEIWLEEKMKSRQAVYFGTKINYSGFPFLDFISGGGHAVAIVGASEVGDVSKGKYVFISDSNARFYAIPMAKFLSYIEGTVGLDWGAGSGDPSFFHHMRPGKGAIPSLQTIEPSDGADHG